MTFKNIEFDTSILETKLKELHLHNLKIVCENLEEFNKRNSKEKDIRYKYHKRKIGYLGNEEFRFDRINETDGYNHFSDYYFTPNWFVYISRNKDDFNNWSDKYCNRVYNSFEQQKNSFGLKEIDLFIKLFEDFYPKGDFLNSEQIKIFKTKINTKCNLAKSYKR